jgi:hypothetical protein
LQNIANNLPDAFIDYKGVMKSWNPVVIAPKRVEVQQKPIKSLLQKRGRGLQPLTRITLWKSDQERRRLELPKRQ